VSPCPAASRCITCAGRNRADWYPDLDDIRKQDHAQTPGPWFIINPNNPNRVRCIPRDMLETAGADFAREHT